MRPISHDTILRIWQVAEILGLSRSTIYNLTTLGSRYHCESFPKPRKLGARSIGWLSSEIYAWIASQGESN